MKKLWVYLAFLGSVMQFAAAFIASNAQEFDRPDTVSKLPVRLHLLPGGLAFAIWPVIFISFVLLGAYQLKPSRLEEERFIQARPFIFLSGLGNTIWFVGDVYQVLTICIIGFILMLGSLIYLNSIFRLGEKSASIYERWFINFPVSLFFGWITVAFPIGVTLWFIKDFGWTGEMFLSPDLWSTLVVLAAFGLFSFLSLTKKVSIVFLSVGIWGLFWIYFRNANTGLLVGYAALLATALLIVELIVIRFFNIEVA